jgi:uncharacterized membrane protein YhaH (DUF805 family)
MLEPVVRLLFSYRGAIGRRDFVLAELARGAGLVVCYTLYREGWFVVAATLVPVAVWPGVVATIKRFRDLGHDPVLILPALMYLSAGVAVGYRYEVPEISWIALGVYLLYVSGVEGQSDTFESRERGFNG